MINCKPMTLREACAILDRDIAEAEVGRVASIEFIVAKNVVINAIEENLDIIEERKFMKTLIVVDMQNDFITGALGSQEAVAIVPNVKDKIQHYVDNGWNVIFTRDTHHTNYLKTSEGKNLPVVHCVEGTHGWEVADGLEVPNCTYINKPSFGWMYWVYQPLHGVEEIEIVGVCTDICVVSNALILKATFPETKITVDASCCAGVTPETHKAALETMKMCQINITNEEM